MTAHGSDRWGAPIRGEMTYDEYVEYMREEERKRRYDAAFDEVIGSDDVTPDTPSSEVDARINELLSDDEVHDE
jgi:hypothetical protein